MPELPEVETIRRDLAKKIRGKTFKKVEIKVAKLVSPEPGRFKKQIKELKVKDIKRRAKVLIFNLSKDLNLLVHLKLTGQLIYRNKKGDLTLGGHPIKQDLKILPNRFSHVIFEFKDGSHLFFNDVRRFGWLKLLNQKDTQNELIKFGVEPMSLEFTLDKFKEILAGRPKTKIKPLLLDQKMIAGIGNIYADESCFRAKIKPQRRVKTFKKEEIKKLYEAIPRILKLSIAKRGTSVDNYVDASGVPGGFVKYLKVYRRRGQKCFRCGGQVKRIILGGRGTHFCPECQK